MIRLLQGQIQSKESRTIILFVNGVGYQVFVPTSILEGNETDVTLFIHTHVREDAFLLYGFRTKNELNFFELLLTINGIGPKMAMDLMNEPVEKLQNAIFTGNLTALTKIPGIGRKTAERMVLELKGKITPNDLNENVHVHMSHEIHPDVISALETLGYKRHHIQKVFAEIELHSEEDGQNTEELIRIFLQRV